MKKIKLFLASSIVEFADERHALKSFIGQLNNVLIDHNIFLRMFICEYADNSIICGRKQDKFLHEIDNCDIFLILAGRVLGDYTLEEYEYALKVQSQRKDNLPKILAGFKVCNDVEQSVKDFSLGVDRNVKQITFKETAGLKKALAASIGELLNGIIDFGINENQCIITHKTINLH